MKKEERLIPGLLEIRNEMKNGSWNLIIELLDKYPRAAAYLEAEKYKNSYGLNPDIYLWQIWR